MKFTISQEKIQSAIWIVSKAISWSNALPILSNLLIEAKDWKLFFTATDLDLTIKFFTSAEIDEEWSITVPAKILQSYINFLKEWDVSFSVKLDNISIKTWWTNTKIKGIPAEDFPKALNIETKETIEISSKELRSWLWQTIFSTSESQSRPVLTWILFKVSWDELSLMSTDSYRFSSRNIKLQKSAEDISVIVPAKSMTELVRIIWEYEWINEEHSTVKIEISENQILFKIWNTEIYSRLIEWQFPNCSMLIPKSSSLQCVVGKSDLNQIIKRINIFAKENNNNIKFEFSDQKIKLSTLDTQIWSDESEIEAAIKWDSISVAMNSIFVLDILNAIKTPEVVIELNGQYNPVLFKNTEDDNFIHIIMPLRV